MQNNHSPVLLGEHDDLITPSPPSKKISLDHARPDLDMFILSTNQSISRSGAAQQTNLIHRFED